MNGIAFDTHAAAKRFGRAGFTEDQVEALVEITRETTALPDISILATKIVPVPPRTWPRYRCI